MDRLRLQAERHERRHDQKGNKRTTALLAVSRRDSVTRPGGVLRGEAAEPA
jgi:hypothetical protein